MGQNLISLWTPSLCIKSELTLMFSRSLFSRLEGRKCELKGSNWINFLTNLDKFNLFSSRVLSYYCFPKNIFKGKSHFLRHCNNICLLLLFCLVFLSYPKFYFERRVHMLSLRNNLCLEAPHPYLFSTVNLPVLKLQNLLFRLLSYFLFSVFSHNPTKSALLTISKGKAFLLKVKRKAEA